MPEALAAVIFDRDGVLNVDHGYVGQVERLEWIPGARRAVARLTAAGVKVIVATNQSGVARGYFDLAAVEALHDAMRAALAEDGGRLDAIYVCPFHEDAVSAEYRIADHPDRKPNPGMVLRALTDFGLDAGQVVLVGDRTSDIEAARRAGVRGLTFEGGDLERFLEARGVLSQRPPQTRNNG